MLSYVAPNFITLKNILASLLHIYHPCFIVQQGLKSEIYYRFIPLLSFHHCLKNEVCYTFILLVSSHDIMVKNETLQKLFILQKLITFVSLYTSPEKIRATRLSISGELTFGRQNRLPLLVYSLCTDVVFLNGFNKINSHPLKILI